MSFNRKLQDIRIKYELSQETLAKMTGVSCQTVSEWERGSKLPEIDKLIYISNRFNISLDELLKDTSAPVRKPISLIKKDNTQAISQLSGNKSDNDTVFHNTHLHDVSYSIKNNKPPETKFVQRVMAPKPVQKSQPYNRVTVAHKYLSNQGQIFHSMKIDSSCQPPKQRLIQKSQPYNRTAVSNRYFSNQDQIFHSMKIDTEIQPERENFLYKLMYSTDKRTNRLDKLKGTISEEEYQKLVRLYKYKIQENRQKNARKHEKKEHIIIVIILMILFIIGYFIVEIYNNFF